MVLINSEDYLSAKTESKPVSGLAQEVLSYSIKTLDSFTARHRTQSGSGNLDVLVQALLKDTEIQQLLTFLADLRVFSQEIHLDFQEHPLELSGLKQLKYFFSLTLGHLLEALQPLIELSSGAEWWRQFKNALLNSEIARVTTGDYMKANGVKNYAPWLSDQLTKDPHCVYPTNIFRQSDGISVSTPDFSTIESVVRMAVSTTVKIRSNVLRPDEPTLAGVYKPFGRCVVLVDSKVEKIYGSDLDAYFHHHSISLVKLVYCGDEVNKTMELVEKILVDMKTQGMARNEPLLVVGGGVISDVGGFAAALYHRSTPYVMLATSLVAAIDAGPSPRRGCDGQEFKNLYGTYHMPTLTLVDRQFFKTLNEAWIRHGIAELIKMGLAKDRALFELIEQAGTRLITTKFGTIISLPDPAFENLCDQIIGKAMEAYVMTEYNNCWETHQFRPHAFGHTWSTGYELPSGLLHGHAVSSDMGFGSYLARRNGWIDDADFERILKLLACMELTLYHPIMDDTELLYRTQLKVVEKRGGRLCAPVPSGELGSCEFINDLSFEELGTGLSEYKIIAQKYPRAGLGIDMLCVDAGLDDPNGHTENVSSSEHNTAQNTTVHPKNVINSRKMQLKHLNGHTENGSSSNNAPREHINGHSNNGNFKTESHSVSNGSTPVTHTTPKHSSFDNGLVGHNGMKQYSQGMTTPLSADLQKVISKTKNQGMFISSQVDMVDCQFLKMLTKLVRARQCLDIGTYNGMSTLALAEGVGKSGHVIALEVEEEAASIAQESFDMSTVGSRIRLVPECSLQAIESLKKENHKFDLVFMNGLEENYVAYFDAVLDSDLLADNGAILTKNPLESLACEDDLKWSNLHEFNTYVLSDPRVEQVVLSIGEGITMIRKV